MLIGQIIRAAGTTLSPLALYRTPDLQGGGGAYGFGLRFWRGLARITIRGTGKTRARSLVTRLMLVCSRIWLSLPYLLGQQRYGSCAIAVDRPVVLTILSLSNVVLHCRRGGRNANRRSRVTAADVVPGVFLPQGSEKVSLYDSRLATGWRCFHCAPACRDAYSPQRCCRSARFSLSPARVMMSRLRSPAPSVPCAIAVFVDSRPRFLF